MSHYPRGDVYRELYARYFDEDKMMEFMKLAGDMNGKNVTDLCGGTGRLSTLIKEHYPEASVLLVDESRLMLKDFKGDYLCTTVYEFLTECDRYSEDVIFCQQAINYWFNELDASRLYTALRPGGKFIFNTFANCPSEVPKAKEYQIDGVNFMEISWYVPSENRVHHIQIREGRPMHDTSFMWISKEDFLSTFNNLGFETQVIERGASLTVIATKPFKN